MPVSTNYCCGHSRPEHVTCLEKLTRPPIARQTRTITDLFSTDNIGMNYDYPTASYERRQEILKEHQTYQKGYFYFLCKRSESARRRSQADEHLGAGERRIC